MGALDRPQGSFVKRRIKLVDVTGKTATEIEDTYNSNFGQVGWRVIQAIVLGAKTFIIAEKEE